MFPYAVLISVIDRIEQVDRPKLYHPSDDITEILNVLNGKLLELP